MRRWPIFIFMMLFSVATFAQHGGGYGGGGHGGGGCGGGGYSGGGHHGGGHGGGGHGGPGYDDGGWDHDGGGWGGGGSCGNQRYVCYAKNYQGREFRAFGRDRYDTERRAIDECRRYSYGGGHSCRSRGCRTY